MSHNTAQLIPTINFNESTLTYSISSCDLQLFIIWASAEDSSNQIIDRISNQYEIIEILKIKWSDTEANNNLLRLYNLPPVGTSAKLDEIGNGEFHAVYIKDAQSNYRYMADSSGTIKLVNTNVVSDKQKYRSITKGNFQVHSSDSPTEFFRNSSLLIGAETTLELISKGPWNQTPKRLSRDLSGSQKWKDTTELFQVLNLSTKYVVLRSHENIEETVQTAQGDIDILCENISEFVAVANARKVGSSENFYHINIAGNPILFDIRRLNDNYFDQYWQRTIISNRILTPEGLYIPRPDDHYFTLIYSGLIYKKSFPNAYYSTLEKLANHLGLTQETSRFQSDSEYMKSVLRGFLEGSGLIATIPKDSRVYINLQSLASISNAPLLSLFLHKLVASVKHTKTIATFKTKSLLRRSNILTQIVRWTRKAKTALTKK